MSEHDTVDLMIMLATQQQIVNFKTFKHYNPNRVVALCSRLARERNWCHGFEVLLDRRFKALPPYADSLMDVIKLAETFDRLLNGELTGAPGKVVWAWAGAQKPHSTALYLLARKYKEGEPGRHTLVYADGNSNAFYEDGSDTPTHMNAPLVAEEVLTVHGLGIPKHSSASTKRSTPAALYAFLTDQKEREREWQLPPFTDAFHRLAENPAANREDIIKLVNDPLPEVLLDSFYKAFSGLMVSTNATKNRDASAFLNAMRAAREQSVCRSLFKQAADRLHLRQLKQENCSQPPSGVSFEFHARARMQQWYDERGGKEGLVSSMSFDVDVEGINQQGDHGTREPESEAQFDCLLVTPQGRFIAIDFKSAGKKNYRAQQASVTIAGGVYAALYYLYPWIDEDLPVEAGKKDSRPDIIKKRMTGIAHMDDVLRPGGRPPKSWRGIRFYKQDEDFYNDLEQVLDLRPLNKAT